MAKSWNYKDDKTPIDMLKAYDRLMGEKIHTIKTRNMTIVILLFINFVLFIAFCYSFTMNKTVPIFISTNEIGEISYLGTGGNGIYKNDKITPAMMETFVSRFITNMSSVSIDPQVNKNNLLFCYASVSNNASNKLTRILRESNFLSLYETISRVVKIESVLERSDDSYQVDFIETTTRHDGGGKTEKRKRAILTTKILEPNEKDILLNPAGLYVVNFDITEIRSTQ